jgi:hypothetical protein
MMIVIMTLITTRCSIHFFSPRKPGFVSGSVNEPFKQQLNTMRYTSAVTGWTRGHVFMQWYCGRDKNVVIALLSLQPHTFQSQARWCHRLQDNRKHDFTSPSNGVTPIPNFIKNHLVSVDLVYAARQADIITLMCCHFVHTVQKSQKTKTQHIKCT